MTANGARDTNETAMADDGGIALYSQSQTAVAPPGTAPSFRHFQSGRANHRDPVTPSHLPGGKN
jgi:hypothetical protein